MQEIDANDVPFPGLIITVHRRVGLVILISASSFSATKEGDGQQNSGGARAKEESQIHFWVSFHVNCSLKFNSLVGSHALTFQRHLLISSPITAHVITSQCEETSIN